MHLDYLNPLSKTSNIISPPSHSPIQMNLVGSMDSSLPSQKKPIKRLGELIQEQQEPFSLDVYLLERGYENKISKSRSDGCACTGKSSKALKRSKRTTCPQILKSVLCKLLSNTDVPKTLSPRQGRVLQGRKLHVSAKGQGITTSHVEELDQFSSASTRTLYDSYSERDSPKKQSPILSSSSEFYSNLGDQVTVTDKTQQYGCLEDNKQHSPVSVLEELSSEEVSSFYHHETVRVTEQSILSASLWDLLQHSEEQANTGVKELRKIVETTSSPSQYRKTKRVLEQTKQLLFDCVREVLEANVQMNRVSGAEQIGKTICEQISFWAMQSANLTNIKQLLISGFCESPEEWNDFQPQTRMMGIDISNSILEELVYDIVTDLIDCFRR